MAGGSAADGLWLRVDRPLRFREEQTRHIQASAVEPDGRLGDVQGHTHWAGQLVVAIPRLISLAIVRLRN